MSNFKSVSIYWFLFCATAFYITSCLYACNESIGQEDDFTFTESEIDYTQSIDSIIQSSASLTPCDSIYFEPVAWGAELRIVSKTISSGNRPPYGPYWQAKSFGWQAIKPTKFQQDSIRERIAFADSDTIRYIDTFYICRKKHL